jgi:hypothetical protein
MRSLAAIAATLTHPVNLLVCVYLVLVLGVALCIVIEARREEPSDHLAFFPLSAVVVLAFMPALITGQGLRFPLILLLGLILFARMVYPVRNPGALLAFRAVTAFLLLLIVVCL